MHTKLTRVEQANQALQNPSGELEHHWLDKHIAEQAAHYGLTVANHSKLMRGAADYQYDIEQLLVDDPDVKLHNFPDRG